MNESLEEIAKSTDLLRQCIRDGESDPGDIHEFAHEILWDIRNGIEGMDYTYQEVEKQRTRVIQLLKIIAKRL